MKEKDGDHGDKKIFKSSNICILVGSYFDWEASRPKFTNLGEFILLQKLFKARMHLQNQNPEKAKDELKNTEYLAKQLIQDKSLFPPPMQKIIYSQYTALMNTIKANMVKKKKKKNPIKKLPNKKPQALLSENYAKSIRILSSNQDSLGLHASNGSTLKQSTNPNPTPSTISASSAPPLSTDKYADMKSLNDLPQSQTHPIHLFNNLGVIHLRLHKYSLAYYYFHKSYRCIANAFFQNNSSNFNSANSHIAALFSDTIAGYAANLMNELTFNMGLVGFCVGVFLIGFLGAVLYGEMGRSLLLLSEGYSFFAVFA